MCAKQSLLSLTEHWHKGWQFRSGTKHPRAGGEESVSAQQGCVCTAELNPSDLLLFLWKWGKLLCTKGAEVLLERREGTLGLALL